jgi:hypothetical protein
MRKRGTSRHYVYTKPSKKAIQAVKDKVTAKTYRSTLYQEPAGRRSPGDNRYACSPAGQLDGPIREYAQVACGDTVSGTHKVEQARAQPIGAGHGALPNDRRQRQDRSYRTVKRATRLLALLAVALARQSARRSR